MMPAMVAGTKALGRCFSVVCSSVFTSVCTSLSFLSGAEIGTAGVQTRFQSAMTAGAGYSPEMGKKAATEMSQ